MEMVNSDYQPIKLRGPLPLPVSTTLMFDDSFTIIEGLQEKEIDLEECFRLGKDTINMNKYVVHCKKDKYDVYIGRPSKWGNPFVVGKDGDREEVILKYKRMIFNNKEMMEQAKKELKGKVLGCWCSPKSCHGDVLVLIANEVVYALCPLCEGIGCETCSQSGYSGT